jgi:C1A family cysteine protease
MRETGQFFSGEEYHFRFGIWLANARFVSEYRGNFQIGLNRLAAVTPAEYRMLLGARVDKYEEGSTPVSPPMKVEYDPKWDWRTKGVVNPVKDQGQCGSCWVFSAIGCAEGVDALKFGKLLSFSESNALDCCEWGNGCNGGVMKKVWDWVVAKQGGKFMLEKDYPYKPAKCRCRWDPSKGVGSCTGIYYLQHLEEEFRTVCQKSGPLSIHVDAALASFQLYTHGIYDDPKCDPHILDHAVVLVGWGFEGERTFWIVRNSWGVTWGEKGYINILCKNNICGVLSHGRLMLA